MHGEVARKIPFCQSFPNKTEKIAKRAENRRAPIGRAKTADTPLNYAGSGGTETRPTQIPHPLTPTNVEGSVLFRLRRRRTGTEVSTPTIVAYTGQRNPP